MRIKLNLLSKKVFDYYNNNEIKDNISLYILEIEKKILNNENIDLYNYNDIKNIIYNIKNIYYTYEILMNKQ